MKIEIKVGSQTYSGRTKTAATQAALDHLAALFPENEHSWIPAVIAAPGGHTGIVYKDEDGSWAYVINWPNNGRGSPNTGKRSRKVAEFKCRRHLAQASCAPGTANDGSAVIHPEDAEGLDDHKRWIAFQNAYAAERAAGADQGEAFRKTWPQA